MVLVSPFLPVICNLVSFMGTLCTLNILLNKSSLINVWKVTNWLLLARKSPKNFSAMKIKQVYHQTWIVLPSISFLYLLGAYKQIWHRVYWKPRCPAILAYTPLLSLVAFLVSIFSPSWVALQTSFPSWLNELVTLSNGKSQNWKFVLSWDMNKLNNEYHYFWHIQNLICIEKCDHNKSKTNNHFWFWHQTKNNLLCMYHTFGLWYLAYTHTSQFLSHKTYLQILWKCGYLLDFASNI